MTNMKKNEIKTSTEKFTSDYLWVTDMPIDYLDM